MKAQFFQNEINHQDHLLQSYRSNFHTAQAAFALGGILLTLGVLGLDSSRALFCAFILLALTSVSYLTGRLMLASIISRTKDVDYWQNELLKYEKDECAEGDQLLTRFKHSQKSRSGQSLTTGLLEKDRGHTRRSLDQKFPKILLYFWIALWIVSITRLVWY